MKTMKVYLITILLMVVTCAPAFGGTSHIRSDHAEKEIKKSFISIGQAGKEAGKVIAQYFKEFGEQSKKVFKKMDRSLRNAAEK